MGKRDDEPAPGTGTLAKIECACGQCAAQCRVAPGWYAPDEARRAINAGLAGLMMLDY